MEGKKKPGRPLSVIYADAKQAITSISMRYWTGTTLRWRRQRRPMKMEQDFFTRCSSTNWIITSTDTPEILRIRWIA